MEPPVPFIPPHSHRQQYQEQQPIFSDGGGVGVPEPDGNDTGNVEYDQQDDDGNQQHQQQQGQPLQHRQPQTSGTASRGASSRVTAAGKRPRLSLASLIGQAVLSSPEQKARLGNIYEWIAERYPEYYRLNQGGWQNSIRHNLTINKAFVRLPKAPGDEPGKGAFWTIHPDHLDEFKDGVFVGKIRGAEYRAMPKVKSNRRSSYTGPLKRHRDFAAGAAPNVSFDFIMPDKDGVDFKLCEPGDAMLHHQDPASHLHYHQQQQQHHDGGGMYGEQDGAYGFSGPPPVGTGAVGSLFLATNPMSLPALAANIPPPPAPFTNSGAMYGYMIPPPLPSGAGASGSSNSLWQSSQMPQLVRSQSSFSFGLSPLASSSTSPRNDQLPMVECGDDSPIMPLESCVDTHRHHHHHNHHGHHHHNHHHERQLGDHTVAHLHLHQPSLHLQQPPHHSSHDSVDSGHFHGYYPPGIQAGDEGGLVYGDEFPAGKDTMRSKSSTPLHILSPSELAMDGDNNGAD